jgi:hypothetical protein
MKRIEKVAKQSKNMCLFVSQTDAKTMHNRVRFASILHGNSSFSLEG